jgi:hypothetical protein
MDAWLIKPASSRAEQNSAMDAWLEPENSSVAQPPSQPPAQPAAQQAQPVAVNYDFDDDDEPQKARWSCDKFRKMIATFLATKKMTQTRFLEIIIATETAHRGAAKCSAT